MLDAWLAGAVTAARIGSDPEQAKAYQALSIGVGTFEDKYRLEMGESTGRTETLTLGLVEQNIQRLEAQLAANDPPG